MVIDHAGGGGGLYMTDGLIWVAGSAFDTNNAVSGGGGILLDPSCATQARRRLPLHCRARWQSGHSLMRVPYSVPQAALMTATITRTRHWLNMLAICILDASHQHTSHAHRRNVFANMLCWCRLHG